MLRMHHVTAGNIVPSPAEEACPETCLDNAYAEGYHAGLVESVPDEPFPYEASSPEFSGV